MTETKMIGEGQSVVETTTFPDGSSFKYVLAVKGEAVHAGMEFDSGKHQLSVNIPAELAKGWSESSEVGLGGEDPIDIQGLKVLIEKDFDCVSPRSGDEKIDTFPNPTRSIC
jgi:hypothetical protein